MASNYNFSLVVLSIIVAMMASYTALDLAGRVTQAKGRSAWMWIIAGSIAMGAGIWSMHFIGMMAFSLPIRLAYDLEITVASLLIAIAISAFALSVVSRPTLEIRRLLTGGLFMGAGICAMHYTGMAAMRMSPPIQYDLLLFMASVLIAIVASVVALYLSFHLRARTNYAGVAAKLLSAIVMGVAISGMHYTAMAAAHFDAASLCLATDAFGLANESLAFTLAFAVLGLLTATLIGSVIDAQMALRTGGLLATVEKANLELKLEIAEKERAQEALREADRRKDMFLATLAHELRNPLAPLGNAMEILRRASYNRATVEEARGIIERQLHQMVRLVDDLLDVARFSTGQFELRKQRCDLTQITRNAVEASYPLISARNHHLEVVLPTEPILVDADSTRLSQTLVNLLNNASKYTAPGGLIHLTVKRSGEQALISVKDNGVGIPEDMRAKIFDPFTQIIDSKEQSQGGLGIGLSIVKRLVEMHGGTIEVRCDEKAKGSEFVIHLPVASASPDAAVAPLADNSGAVTMRKLRVLVADDNRDAAETLSSLLSLLGHEVRTTYDGHQAIREAEAFRPELILLDIGMPGLSGHDVARRLRALPEFQRVTIVALTGWGQPDDRAKTQEAGFDHHLLKPLDLAALEKFINQRFALGAV